MIYEGFRSGFDNAFNVHFEDNFSFPVHIHRNYEMIVMLEGELIVNINGTDHTVRQGEALIIFPYQCHSYRNAGEHKTLVYIFSAGIVPYFHHQVEKAYSACPIFSLRESRILPTLKTVNKSNFSSYEAEMRDTLMRKGILYTLLSTFMRQAELRPRELSNDTILLERILMLIDSMPPDKVSLQSIAEELQYEYSYISKYFKQAVGISFTNYVNQYRIHIACQLLQDEKSKMIDIAMRVGYNSLRSFNGNFKKITGITPVQYVAGAVPNWTSTGDVSEFSEE